MDRDPGVYEPALQLIPCPKLYTGAITVASTIRVGVQCIYSNNGDTFENSKITEKDISVQ